MTPGRSVFGEGLDTGFDIGWCGAFDLAYLRAPSDLQRELAVAAAIGAINQDATVTGFGEHIDGRCDPSRRADVERLLGELYDAGPTGIEALV